MLISQEVELCSAHNSNFSWNKKLFVNKQNFEWLTSWYIGGGVYYSQERNNSSWTEGPCQIQVGGGKMRNQWCTQGGLWGLSPPPPSIDKS